VFYVDLRILRSEDCLSLRPEDTMSKLGGYHSTSIVRGFSLVELVVVIGVIAVIMGLLLPTLAKSQAQAMALRCSSQLQQLGEAFNMYADVNGGYTPSWSGTHVYPAGKYPPPISEPGLAWTERLMTYYVAPDSKAYQCPAFEDVSVDYFIAGRWENLNDRRSIKLSDIKTSTAFILSGDCTGSIWHLPPYGTSPDRYDDCDKDDSTKKCLVFFGEAGGMNMHPQGNNVLFADGHVAAFAHWRHLEMTYSPHRMQPYEGVTAD